MLIKQAIEKNAKIVVTHSHAVQAIKGQAYVHVTKE